MLDDFFYTNSRSPVFFKISVLNNFVKLTAQHVRRSLFLIKLKTYDLELFQKRLRHRCFAVNFAKFLKTHFS